MQSGAVIGLEIHVQLRTSTKLFCADVATSVAAPNTQVCPVCLGLPGALPALNEAAVDLAVRAALGLGCTVQGTSVFERKSYFYPDLPKGYQITQHAHPLATGGVFESVRIRRLHLEEDAGRLLHERVPRRTAIDLNRAGIPLIEIVTEPDLRDPAAARSFLTRLRGMLKHLGVSDCEMENGSLRVDANVSVRGDGTITDERTEVKNLNSFAHVEHALAYEIERQGALVAAGGSVATETLLWDSQRGRTRRMRGKEESRDYRYLVDPDLAPLRVAADRMSAIRAAMPELPAAKQARFAAAYDLPSHAIEALTAEPALAEYFEAVAARVPARAASSWILTDVRGWLNRHGSRVESMPVRASALAELITLVEQGTLSRSAARRVFAGMARAGGSARAIVAAEGLGLISDSTRIAEWVEQTIAAFPDEVERYRAGRKNVMSFLIGQVMKLSGGTADPRRGGDLLRDRLDR